MQSPQACHLLYDRRPGETYMDSQLLTCRQIASIKSWTLVTVCQVYRRALVTVGQVYKQAQRSRRMTSLRFSAVLLTLTWSLGLSLPFQHVSAVHHGHLVFFFINRAYCMFLQNGILAAYCSPVTSVTDPNLKDQYLLARSGIFFY